MSTSFAQRGTRAVAQEPKIFRLWPLLAGALCFSILAAAGPGYAAESAVPPEAARAMTGVELYELYRDRSWQWSDGAGLMETEGRRFAAIVKSEDETGWAEGRWIVTDSGRFCFDAEWQMPNGTFLDKTCFRHLLHEGTIYQRKEPAGDWYVFRHAEPATVDEFNKLVRQDLVSSDLEAVKAVTSARQQPSNHIQQE